MAVDVHQPAPAPRFAGVGIRFLATLIDAFMVGLVVAPLADVTFERHPAFFLEIRYTSPASVSAWVISIAYFTILEGTIGATVGKLVVGLRVRAEDGTNAGFGSALVRNLLRVIDAVPYALPYLLGAIFVWTSPTRQRLGDRIAKTVVIHQRSRPSPAASPIPATTSSASPAWTRPPSISPPSPELPPPPPGPPTTGTITGPGPDPDRGPAPGFRRSPGHRATLSI
jgi:uncharacterized RDD family membrane protein YckC